jgi:hypothetical protein
MKRLMVDEEGIISIEDQRASVGGIHREYTQYALDNWIADRANNKDQ